MYCQKCGTTKDLNRNSKRKLKDGSIRFSYLCRPCNTKRCKTYRKNGGMKFQYRATRRYAIKNPLKVRAWQKIDALRPRKRPCERCGAKKGVHAHHDDYSQPEAVKWLCPLHHKERHRELAAS